MRISVLTAENVRNLRPLKLEPRERFNVFVGDNGQGKTNLLEVIYAVASLRSFRTSRLADMIAFASSSVPAGRASSESDEDSEDELADEGGPNSPPQSDSGGSRDSGGSSRSHSGGGGGGGGGSGGSSQDASAIAYALGLGAAVRGARIGARVLKDDLTRVYEVTIGPTGRKVTLDGKAARPLARYFGGFNVVVFTPEDLQLPRGAPGDRRRFLDRAVFNARPEYLAHVQDYEKVLKQRNALLKMHAQQTMSTARVEEMLSIYDEQLAHVGQTVANQRASLVEALQPEISQAFAAITHGDRKATAHYVSKTAGASIDEIMSRHREGRMKDLATSSTQFGPHRDDLAFALDGHDAGGFASQGQLRAIMLAWKTAELAVLTRTHGDQPILLLDDVSSELDPARNAYLFEHLAAQAGQCFITTTHESHVLLHRERANYRIENGQISS